MSKRARRRARETGQVTRRGAPAARTARASLDSTRRALAQKLGGAAILAVVALVGTAGLGGTLAPLIVLAVVLGGALLVHARARTALDGVSLVGEDRTLDLLGSMLLVVAVGFSVVALVVLAVT